MHLVTQFSQFQGIPPTFFWLELAEEGLLHGFLQLLDPETVFLPQEGSDVRVGDTHQRVSFQRLGPLGLEVDDRGKAVVHDHHGEVGRARGEGFVPALG